MRSPPTTAEILERWALATPHHVAVVEEGPRYGADGDGFSLYVRDPEGNTIELKGPSA